MSKTLIPIRLKNAEDDIGRLRKTVLEIFVNRLTQHEQDNLLRVVLFGSVARGDSNPDSDIDVFILLKEGTWELRNRIIDVATDVALEEGECKTHISAFVNFKEKYEEDSWLPVFQFIREEGVVLYDAAR